MQILHMKLMQNKLKRYRIELFFLFICLILMIIGVGLAQSLSKQKITLANEINGYQDFKLRIAEAKYISELTDNESILKISQFLNNQNLTFNNEGNSFEITDIDAITMMTITDYLASLNVQVSNIEGKYNSSTFTVRFIVE